MYCLLLPTLKIADDLKLISECKMKTTILFLSLLICSNYSITIAQDWELVGLDSISIYGLKVKGDTIWANGRANSSNYNSGLFKSTNNGLNWIKLDSLLGNAVTLTFSLDENNTDKIFLIKGLGNYSNAGYFYKTTNNGLSWDSIATPGDAPIKDFIISPLDPNEYYTIIYTYGQGFTTVQLFFKSINAGDDWVYECCPGDPFSGMIMNFAIDKINPEILYISGTSYGAFFNYSTDRGNNWQTLSGEGGYIVFTDLFSHERIYIFQYNSRFYSDDGGITWNTMNGEFTSDAIFLSFFQDENTSTVYALMNEGLFYSRSDSIYWKLIPGSESLPLYNNSSHYFDCISVISEFNRIYIGTSSGIYSTTFITEIDDIPNSNIPSDFYLGQNYPNPFNPVTTINYSVPKTSNVNLIVYDVLGREIKTLVSGEKLPGNYNIQFDGSDLSSGVYLYVMRAEDPSSGSGQGFIDTKKLILIK